MGQYPHQSSVGKETDCQIAVGRFERHTLIKVAKTRICHRPDRFWHRGPVRNLAGGIGGHEALPTVLQSAYCALHTHTYDVCPLAARRPGNSDFSVSVRLFFRSFSMQSDEPLGPLYSTHPAVPPARPRTLPFPGGKQQQADRRAPKQKKEGKKKLVASHTAAAAKHTEPFIAALNFGLCLCDRVIRYLSLRV